MPPLAQSRPVSFDRLFYDAVPNILAGDHQRDTPPVDGGRWPVSVLLMPSRPVAARLDEITRELTEIAGPRHFLTGTQDYVHFTVRALERYRAAIAPDDPFVRRCATAMAAAARRCLPVRLRVTGLTLTAGTVMACAEPLDGEAWHFMSVLGEELAEDGWFEAGFRRDIWYLNLLHFAADLADPVALVEYVAARRAFDLGECVTDWSYLVRFEHVPNTGMRPVLLSQAAFGAAAAMDESRSITVG